MRRAQYESALYVSYIFPISSFEAVHFALKTVNINKSNNYYKACVTFNWISSSKCYDKNRWYYVYLQIAVEMNEIQFSILSCSDEDG